jgi:hypothetical protein
MVAEHRVFSRIKVYFLYLYLLGALAEVEVDGERAFLPRRQLMSTFTVCRTLSVPAALAVMIRFLHNGRQVGYWSDEEPADAKTKAITVIAGVVYPLDEVTTGIGPLQNIHHVASLGHVELQLG